MLNKQEREDLCMDFSLWTEQLYNFTVDGNHDSELLVCERLFTLKRTVGHLGYEFIEKYNHGNGIIDFDLVKRTDE